MGETWANAPPSGELGTKAASAMKEIGEAITANKELSAAENERATTYGLAYEKYIAFKRVVRDALGPASKQYRRIPMRASPGAGGDAKGDDDALDAKPGDAAGAKPEGGDAGAAGADASGAAPPGGDGTEPK